MYNIANIKRLHLEPSSRCNASCPACSRNQSGGPVVPDIKLEDLSLDDIKLMFAEGGIEKQLTMVNYCGNIGDPLMAPDMLGILDFFATKNETGGKLCQQIRTNAGMRNEEFWRDLGTFFSKQPTLTGPDPIFHKNGVVFSVDGLEDTNHIYRRNVRWEKVYAHMRAFTEAGGTGIWEFLIFEHNQHQIEEARAMATSMGLSFVTKNAHGFGEFEGKQHGLSVYNKNSEFEYTIYPANYTGPRDGGPGPGSKLSEYYYRVVPILTDYNRDIAKNSTIKCKSLTPSHHQEIYISASGHLLPCCFLGGVLGHKFTSYSRWQFDQRITELGMDKIDLRQRSIVEVLNDTKFQELFLDGWKKETVEDGRLLFCAEVCGERSHMDTLYNRG